MSAGRSDHFEAVQVHYDPAKLDYANILHIFWRQIDPTDATESIERAAG